MADNDRKSLLVICGPTATGKTALSVRLAKSLNGEIISADSMQLYKGLNIGTAKPTNEEMNGIKHHLMDFLEPKYNFSAADYAQYADKAINNIIACGKTPFLVGGTGQYISAVTQGLSFVCSKPDEKLRNKIADMALEIGNDAMYKKLCDIDAEYAASVHPNNAHRVQRAIELYMQTGYTMSEQLVKSHPQKKPYNDIIFVLNYSDRELLYNKINTRVDIMLEQGLLIEAKEVYNNKDRFKTAAQAIGYKEIFPYFEGEQSLDECVDKLKQASRNYAKRQMTWFKRLKDTHNLYVDKQDCEKVIMDIWKEHK
ncbi:MAG: tRNA (adenosine(37)-N6)-dimethylallyltransferase MiaA [Oscillospiraceae bacterium]